MYHEKPTLPDIRQTGYPDFFAPDNAPLDLAAVVAGTPSLLSRNVWRKRLEVIGENSFRYELYLFWCDLRAGEGVRSRARVFTNRPEGLGTVRFSLKSPLREIFPCRVDVPGGGNSVTAIFLRDGTQPLLRQVRTIPLRRRCFSSRCRFSPEGRKPHERIACQKAKQHLLKMNH